MDVRRSAVEPTRRALERDTAALPRRAFMAIRDDDVARAAEVIERAGLLQRIVEWEAADRRGPGGAPRTFEVDALLVGLLLCAWFGLPMTALAVRDVLFRQVSDEGRRLLGVPEPPHPDDINAWKANYRNVRYRFHRLVALMNPSPLPKNRVIPGDEFETLCEPDTPEHAAARAVRYERLAWFCNQLLQASFEMVPREVRRRWRGSVGLDATPVNAFASFDKRARGKGPRSAQQLLRSSSDPDAGVYTRTGDHNGDNAARGAPTLRWAFELSIAVMGRNEPDEPDEFPLLVIGMAPLHRPGHDPGRNGIQALNSIVGRGHPAGYLGADRAYSNQVPGNFQLPAAALGYEPVFDYTINQLGIAESYAGAIQVEGGLYCPAMPPDLIEATIDLRRETGDPAKITREVYQQRIDARERYRLRPHGKVDPEGHVRLLCPAAGAGRTMVCDRKPDSRRKGRGKPRVSLTHLLRDEPARICAQTTVTFPPEFGAKLRQPLAYGSVAWKDRYSSLRNTIEGANGTAKDGSYAALDDASRRRIRGVAAQSAFVAFLLFAVNLQKIDKFRQLRLVDPDGSSGAKRRIRRRTSKPLAAWRPHPAADMNDPPDDLRSAS